MDIKTKYNIDEEVYYLEGILLRRSVIYHIAINISEKEALSDDMFVITYGIRGGGAKREGDLHKSKEDLILAISEKIKKQEV